MLAANAWDSIFLGRVFVVRIRAWKASFMNQSEQNRGEQGGAAKGGKMIMLCNNVINDE